VGEAGADLDEGRQGQVAVLPAREEDLATEPEADAIVDDRGLELASRAGGVAGDADRGAEEDRDVAEPEQALDAQTEVVHRTGTLIGTEHEVPGGSDHVPTAVDEADGQARAEPDGGAGADDLALVGDGLLGAEAETSAGGEVDTRRRVVGDVGLHAIDIGLQLAEAAVLVGVGLFQRAEAGVEPIDVAGEALHALDRVVGQGADGTGVVVDGQAVGVDDHFQLVHADVLVRIDLGLGLLGLGDLGGDPGARGTGGAASGPTVGRDVLDLAVREDLEQRVRTHPDGTELAGARELAGDPVADLVAGLDHAHAGLLVDRCGRVCAAPGDEDDGVRGVALTGVGEEAIELGLGPSGRQCEVGAAAVLVDAVDGVVGALVQGGLGGAGVVAVVQVGADADVGRIDGAVTVDVHAGHGAAVVVGVHGREVRAGEGGGAEAHEGGDEGDVPHFSILRGVFLNPCRGDWWSSSGRIARRKPFTSLPRQGLDASPATPDIPLPRLIVKLRCNPGWISDVHEENS